MIVERKPCDDAFDRASEAFKKSAEKLQGAAMVCVRQAGHDLARACRLFRDPEISSLGARLVENLRGSSNFENVKEACQIFTSRRRGSANTSQPEPADLVVFAALSLEDACEKLGDEDLLSVGPSAVQSRASSGEILHVLRHLA